MTFLEEKQHYKTTIGIRNHVFLFNIIHQSVLQMTKVFYLVYSVLFGYSKHTAV